LDTYTLAQDLSVLETTLERHVGSGNRQGTSPKTNLAKEQFHKVALKILIQTSEEKNSAIVTPRVSKPYDYANHMFMRL
jgi:hypothetical protein